MGISRRRFEGWEPRTVYSYDGDRVVAAVPESEWDERSRVEMLALGAWEARQCPGCGQDLALTTDPKHEHEWKPASLQCNGCLVKSMSESTKAKDEHPTSWLHAVRRRRR